MNASRPGHAGELAHPRSAELYERACRVTPGGVNSPVRAFRAVGGTPLFIARGSGSLIFDADGRSYLDFVGSWGPLIARPRAPCGREAVQEAARARHHFRRAVRSRGGARRARSGQLSCGRAGALRLLGNRGGDERNPTRARLHLPRPDREVCRLLPRTRRSPAGRGGLGTRDFRPAVVRRRARSVHRLHARAAARRRGGAGGAVRRRRAAHCGGHHRARAGQSRAAAAAARVPYAAARADARARRAADLRRGDLGFPSGARRRRRSCSASLPISPRSAR